jgi:hypothetical protein
MKNFISEADQQDSEGNKTLEKFFAEFSIKTATPVPPD